MTDETQSPVVHKFGGTSVVGSTSLRSVAAMTAVAARRQSPGKGSRGKGAGQAGRALVSNVR